jgi:protein archease
MLQPGYTLLDHPSDLGIEARGENLSEAFRYAALALLSVILDLSSVTSRESREVAVSAPDPEALLVRWLAELLYLYDGGRFACRDVLIRSLSGTHLDATLLGEPFDPNHHRTRTDVKAVTYHQLAIRETGEGVVATVFLDI